MSEKPRYFTVNITVEDEDGTLIYVLRSEVPFSSAVEAFERAKAVAENAPSLGFDRMDE